MADLSIPVFVQLPGYTHKVLAGELSWDPATKVGSFQYATDYFKLERAYPLDLFGLPRRPRKETRNDGIYGILRDAGPDAWGRDLLERTHGALDAIGILTHAPQDGAGNITFHPEQQLRTYSLAEIDDVSKGFPPDDSALAIALDQPTSMGGAKPKLLAYDQGAFWMAKFPENNDPEYKNAANEHAMLAMAAQCGIDAAESRVHQLPDGRLILLVKRFDLAGAPGEFTRLGFASAHTVLGMGDPLKDGDLKSYPLLRFQGRRWTQTEIGPDLWRRLAFNALVSNMDDHARNHAFVYDGKWSLSKAFDIVAAPADGPVRLILRITRDTVIATPQSLLDSADEMGVERDQAIDSLRAMAGLVLDQWRGHIRDGWMTGGSIDILKKAFRLAEEVAKFDYAALPLPARSKRYRRHG